MVTDSAQISSLNLNAMKLRVTTREIADVETNGSTRVQSQTRVGTELVTFLNRKKMRLVGFHDYPVGVSDRGNWMIVLPGFGETKTEVLSESYFLAKSGLHTLRFDYSCHVGESDGDILDTTLENMKDDILSSLDYLYCCFGPEKVGVVASSLASRALLRAAREDDRIRLLLNLVSVVDLRKTLFAIYQEDYFQRAKDGLAVGAMDVLGFQVDADSFLRSAIENHYEDLKTTLEDMRHIDAPVVFFAAEKDAWVKLEDVRQAIHAVSGKRTDLHILEDAMHELHENPSISQRALNGIVHYAVLFLLGEDSFHRLTKPNLKEIGFRLRKEKKRSKILHSTSKEEEREFWKSYLDKYSFVVNIPDYWDLMNLVYILLGELKPQDRILDAGCGIGNYETFLRIKLLYAARNQPILLRKQHQALHYVGLDFVREAMIQAKHSQRNIEKEFVQIGAFTASGRLLISSYFLADLETALPFRENTFDKVCCNLVISYLRNPEETVGELVRLLKPGGRIVVTSLKPFADLSQVYRNFVKVAKGRADLAEAQKLLSNAGRIKAKEAQGIYQFFSEDALMDLLRQASVCEVETYRSLGNQANVVVGVKA
jgi:SAM-dependent methyltransferase/esterase/lipase